jgi:hypothetical protein
VLVKNTFFTLNLSFLSVEQQVPAHVLLLPKLVQIVKCEEAPAADTCSSQLSPNLSTSTSKTFIELLSPVHKITISTDTRRHDFLCHCYCREIQEGETKENQSKKDKDNFLMYILTLRPTSIFTFVSSWSTMKFK